MYYYYSFKNTDDESLVTVIVYEVRRFALNWSGCYTISVLLNDNISFYSAGKQYDMKAGDIIITNPHTSFSTLSTRKGRYMLSVSLSPKVFTRYRDNNHTLLFNVNSSIDGENSAYHLTLRALCARLMLAGISNNPSDLAYFEGYTHLLVGLLIWKFPHDLFPNIKIAQEINGLFTFQTMLSYIETHFNENIKLEDVARVGNYNPNYVSQFFRIKSGVNFYEYLTRIRLFYAINLINNSNLSFTEIALQSGFPSHKALSRSFIQYYGISPSDYRTRIRSGDFSTLRVPRYNIGDTLTESLAHPFSERIAQQRSEEVDNYLLSTANSSDFYIDNI